MSWGWYLQVDMQLFLYSLFLLMIFQKNKLCGYISIYASTIAVFAYSMQQTYDNSIHNITHFSDFPNYTYYQENIYEKPYGRGPTYFYGLFLGIMYDQFLKAKKQFNSQRGGTQPETSFLLSLKYIF